MTTDSYAVRVGCENCRTEGYLHFAYGVEVRSARCPVCGVAKLTHLSWLSPFQPRFRRKQRAAQS